MRSDRIAGRVSSVGALVLLVTLAASPFPWARGIEAASANRPAGGPARPLPSCSVLETSRAPLVVDGSREMYVEPSALLPSRGRIVLAGTPTYLWSPGGAGDPREFVRDSVFGAILGPDGQARTIPNPIDAPYLTNIRGAATADGRWAFVFSESKHPTDVPQPDSVLAVWYGVFDGTTWVTRERLPIPANSVVQMPGASDVVVRGDTTFFATYISDPRSGLAIVLFERRENRWTATMVETGGGAYVQIASLDSLGLTMAVVRPDRTLRADRNSLFVLERRASWAAARKLAAGPPEPIHHPVFITSRAGPVLTWVALAQNGRRARAMIGSLDARTPVLTLDSTVTAMAVADNPDQPPLWITEHIDAGARELRFISPGTAGGAVVIAAVPSPYTGFFAAAVIGGNEVLLSGPLLRPAPPNPSLVTLLIRSRVECRPGAP